MNVVIADDSRVMRSIIGKAVDSLGHNIIYACNGQEVLDYLEKCGDEIELILLDWNMPVLTGFEALQRMQENCKYQNIPVLMVSTESEDQKVDQAKEAGACGYLAKPFTQEELSSAIQMVIS
ncbi:MAG: response regulator [Deltaproteobacteria bacterium]|nr:response regulator [Deltaproteobacteria bacterium]